MDASEKQLYLEERSPTDSPRKKCHANLTTWKKRDMWIIKEQQADF